MICSAIHKFYLTDEMLENTPSRKDGIGRDTETTLRIYGCDLIQESGILLRLPQAVIATGQVIFHRFYCKKSLASFNVKKVAAASVWLASKLEENQRKARYVISVFHRMECRRENLSIDLSPEKYSELKNDLDRTERHLQKETGFIFPVEHPHKFICNYLAALEIHDLIISQEAWNLANDSLRTTLCIRFKSQAIACGVVYAAARRFQVPLPENPPWWKAFDVEKHQIDEVCRVLANLYHRPKAQYISVCKDWETFNKPEPVSKVPSRDLPTNVSIARESVEAPCSRNETTLASHKLKDSKTDEDTKSLSSSGLRTEANRERNTDKERDRDKHTESNREKSRKRGRDSERDCDKPKDKVHLSKSGHSEKSRHHHSSHDRYYHDSYTSREKDRHRHC